MNTTYEIRIDGHLDPHWSSRLGGLSIAHRPDGTTALSGPIADQSALHGVLTSLRDLAVPLLSIDTAPAPQPSVSDPLNRATWPRTTDRLTIRRATTDDADATFAFRQREDVAHWLTELPTDPVRYRDRFVDAQRLAVTLIIERGGQVIGDLMLRVEDAWTQQEAEPQGKGRQAELAWVLDPAHTGHGYATEAARELLRLCFNDLGMHRVTATCFADNAPSWRLMERVGLRRELHAQADALHRSGKWMDTYGYALTAVEWTRADPR
ncbi:GNAT family N-acetyltransferase [Pedococcus soli]